MTRQRSYVRAALETIGKDPRAIAEFLGDLARALPRGPGELRNALHVWHRTIQALQQPEFLEKASETIQPETIEEVSAPFTWNAGFTDDFCQFIPNVHTREDCEPPCPIHAPSEHPMRQWPLLYRRDRQVFERICPHLVGHPDPDSIAYHARHCIYQGSHDCDGCCTTPEYVSAAPGPDWDPED